MRIIFYFFLTLPFCFAFTLGATKPPTPSRSIRIGFAGYPSSNLFALGYDEYSEAISSLVLEPLIRMSPDNLLPEPGLAQLKSTRNEATEFDFEINPLAYFSDGSRVTSKDVCFTFNVIRGNRGKLLAYGSLFKNFKKCTVISDRSVSFKADRSIWIAPQLFSQLFILPEHVFGKGDLTKDFNDTYIGSGPYLFESVKWGHSIKLKQNPSYWGKNLPQNKNKFTFDRIEFHIQSNPTALVKMLTDHQIDYLYFLSAQSWVKGTDHPLFLEGKIKKLEVRNKLPFAQAGVAWNLRRPLFKDIRVRKALALLFNRRRLLKDFFFDQYQLATGIAPPQSIYHHPDNLPLAFRPKEAAKLLQEAGWKKNSGGFLEKNGKIFAFQLLSGFPPSSKIWAFYQEELRKAGIQMSVRIVDWSSFIKLRNSGDFDALDFSRNRDEILSDLSLTWHGAKAHDPASGNITGLNDASVNQLLERIDSSPPGKQRTGLIQTLDLLISKQFPIAFSWEPRSQRIAYWNNYRFNQPGFSNFSRWNQLFHFWTWCERC